MFRKLLGNNGNLVKIKQIRQISLDTPENIHETSLTKYQSIYVNDNNIDIARILANIGETFLDENKLEKAYY